MPGRRVLITGAAGGIGAATARRFAAAGARLALVDLESDTLYRLAEELGAAALPANVAEAAEARRAADEAARGMTGIDALVTLAGINPKSRLEALTLDEWNKVLAVNLTGTMLFCQAALPHLMRGNAPAIVTMASAAAHVPWGPGAAAYNASKGGVIALTKALAIELGPAVRANTVCPGAVDTAMFTGPNAPDARARIAENYALRRIASPDDVAQAVYFLASPEAGFVSGTVLTVDGGRSYH